MRLLILGGTVFLGRHAVDAALARGHQVTLFNRGRHAGLFPDVEQLRGDRDGGLDPLHGRQWDAVLDTSGYLPRIVRAGAELLAGSVAHYTFVSSISVFRDFATPNQDEDAPLGALADPTTETVDGATYGPLKVLCEQAVQSAFPARSLIVRPGLIVGPHDPTDRFTYWPWRLAGRPAGDSLPVPGDVLAPGDPAAAVQFVDVRDLAGWMVRLIEARVSGVFNATGPEGPKRPERAYTMGELLHICRQVAESEASRSGELIWADEGFLLQAEVKPWTELPLWVPSSDPRMAHMQRVDCSRARAAGLTFRPVAETVRDTLAWARTRPADHTWRAGLPAGREAEVLREWRAQQARPASGTPA
jgi:2'-hydroxyisoflavone reductase